jgi:hypothetical protein
MGKKQFPLWLENSEIQQLKKEAKKEKLSVNSLVKNKMLSEAQRFPNLALGNWWNNPDTLAAAMEKLKDKRK